MEFAFFAMEEKSILDLVACLAIARVCAHFVIVFE